VAEAILRVGCPAAEAPPDTPVFTAGVAVTATGLFPAAAELAGAATEVAAAGGELTAPAVVRILALFAWVGVAACVAIAGATVAVASPQATSVRSNIRPKPGNARTWLFRTQKFFNIYLYSSSFSKLYKN
jgi:hypothetical protein